MSGKIALPTTPKLESQSLLGETESKGVVTRRLLKGAALGAAAWLIVTSALGAGPAWVSSFFSPWKLYRKESSLYACRIVMGLLLSAGESMNTHTHEWIAASGMISTLASL